MAPKRDLSHLNQVLYGGDYNPDQWPESVWEEDIRLMQEAGVNMVSLAIFSWAKIEPREGEWNFGWLDKLMDMLHAGGIWVDLATATAAPPPWMALKYPESRPMTRDGIVLYPGSRQGYCPHSSAYREGVARLATKMAERYGTHPGLAMWHINNEYACHVAESFTPAGEAAFRVWLQKRYGTLDVLNHAWGTAFWSQRYGDWAEIFPPRTTPTFVNPTHLLDWKRFSNDALVDLYRIEVDVLRRITPDVPVVTNFMGFFKATDYWTWAPHEDIVSDDCYPDPADPDTYIDTAMRYDLMRSLRQSQPWLLMEQSPNAVNWRNRNAAKRPNKMRLWSYQAVSRAANGVMFFQWRMAKAGAEKFHGAMVPHSGEDSRTFREIKQLGAELKKLSGLLDTTNKPDVAMVFDWDNWWVLEQESHPSVDINMLGQTSAYYRALHRRNIPVDFVPSTASLETLSKYKLVVVPNLYLTRAGVAEVFEKYTAAGGTMVIAPFSGITDENDHVWLGGYPAPFRTLLGIRIDEHEAMTVTNAVITDDEERFEVNGWRDSISLRGATPVARFGEDFFADTPAITSNALGAGRAFYVGTLLNPEGMDWLFGRVLDEAGVKPALTAPAGVEMLIREGQGGRYLFALNHNEQPVSVTLPAGVHAELLTGKTASGRITLESNGVAIFKMEE
jgi:beta-galactosidase